jgi:beta-lactamase class A
MTTWDTLVAVQNGAFSIAAKNLGTHTSILNDHNRRVEAASTIKLLVLCCLLRRVQEGDISLHHLAKVTEEDITPSGSGLLQFAAPQAPFEWQHLALLMMAVSDNIATNTIIRRLGRQRINSYARTIGLSQTQLLTERLDFKTKSREGFKLGVTTAHEMMRLLELLVTGKLLDATHTAIALNMLSAVQGSSFARRINLAPLQQFGSKTGWLYSPSSSQMILNECGTFTTKDGVVSVFAVFSTLPLDQHKPTSLDSSSRHTFARVAEAVFRDLSR